MAFRWRPNHGQTLNSGLVALLFFRGSGPVLLKNKFFVIFQGGSRRPVPPLDLPMPAYLLSLISTLVINFLEIIIAKLATFKISVAVLVNTYILSQLDVASLVSLCCVLEQDTLILA